MEHEEQNDPVAQSFVSKTLLIGSATTTADSSEGDNREEPVVREEEIDETEVSEEVVVGVARLPKEPLILDYFPEKYLNSHQNK